MADHPCTALPARDPASEQVHVRRSRLYGFLSSILPYTNAEWEKLSIFLNFLIPKLPAPEEDDLSKGILETIDMDSYRVEKQAAVAIQLEDSDAEIGPVPMSPGGGKPEPELDRLSNIVAEFNDEFGDIAWDDIDRVRRMITEEIPDRVAADTAYQNAKANSERAECADRTQQGPRPALAPERSVTA